MKINKIEGGFKAYAETMGVERAINLRLVPEAKEGDYVLVHAGFAMEIIDPSEAEARIRLLKSILEEPA
jgi:hydrogenase expression/formation protein HypC